MTYLIYYINICNDVIHVAYHYLYFQVLQAVKSALPREANVTTIVADFEAAFWRAVQEEMPHCQLRGCVFHWTQAVWRKVQFLGRCCCFRNCVKLTIG